MKTKVIGQAIAVVGMYLLVGSGLYVINYVTVQLPRNQLRDAVHVGMQKKDVVARLGLPNHIARSLDELDTAGYWPKPLKPVEKEVLEYRRGIYWKLYVYIDKQDRVSLVILSKT